MERTNKLMSNLLFIFFYLSLVAIEIIIIGPYSMAYSASSGNYLINPILYLIFNFSLIAYLLVNKNNRYIIQYTFKYICNNIFKKVVFVVLCILMFYLTFQCVMFSTFDIKASVILNFGFIKLSLLLCVALFGIRK